MAEQQSELNNDAVKAYSFLKQMYKDSYFPNKLVDKGKSILVNLCVQIERSQPKSLEELYELTHAETDRFNDLQEDFEDNDSELETVARECIASDFQFIATSYGFQDADVEELIASRDW